MNDAKNFKFGNETDGGKF